MIGLSMMHAPPYRVSSSWFRGAGVVCLRAALLAMVLLPLYGMWLWYHAPVGLFAPEPVHMNRIWPLVYRTLGLSAVVVSGCLFLGTFFAWAETRLTYFGRGWLAVLVLLPSGCPKLSLGKDSERGHGAGRSIGARIRA